MANDPQTHVDQLANDLELTLCVAASAYLPPDFTLLIGVKLRAKLLSQALFPRRHTIS
jgi:hypothetical protein